MNPVGNRSLKYAGNCCTCLKYKFKLFSMRVTQKVILFNLLCWPMKSEVDVGNMTVKVETYIIFFSALQIAAG